MKGDSYKLSHHKQYEEGTTKIYSYLESRGGDYPGTIFFGLQYYLKEYLNQTVTVDNLAEASPFAFKHFGGREILNYKGWEYIVDKLKGKLPILIKAVPEGTYVPTGNVLMTIENTDPECYWLTNFVETLLMKIWYPITIATNSFFCKRTLKESLERTGNPVGLDFMLHDFGYRGVSSEETAALGGMAHLTSFKGTDTLAGILCAMQHYNSDVCGFSVPASEHSTMTAWGKDREDLAIMNMIESYPEGIVSVVGDSYDIYSFCTRISKDPIKKAILERQGTFVVRPDSGDPLEVLNRVFDILWEGFGGTYNDKHYKVLDPHIRVIQGDGIDAAMIGSILKMLEAKKFSAENIVFGSGGGLLQKFDRDTCKFAIKASYGEKDITDPRKKENTVYTSTVVPFNIQKNPITSSGKKSKAGMLKLAPSIQNGFITMSSAECTPHMFNSYANMLVPVYQNGEILKEYTFDQVRERVKKYL